MADVIDYKIYGDDMQAVEVELDPNEGVRAEAGAMPLYGRRHSNANRYWWRNFQRV